jgi:alkylhydroperoxidase family enzyme
MAQENVKKFMELLNNDEELQKKMKAATESFAGDKSDEKAVFDAVLAPIAKEAGCEFTFEDMKELANASDDDEISEDEAATAAGGFYMPARPDKPDSAFITPETDIDRTYWPHRSTPL